MARDKRIDQLTAVSVSGSDLIGVYDVSNPGTKKVTVQQVADFIAPVGGLSTIWITTSAGATVNVPAIIGKTVQMILRPGANEEIITVGVPDSDQILVDNTTGDITAGNPWVGEKILIQYT